MDSKRAVSELNENEKDALDSVEEVLEDSNEEVVIEEKIVQPKNKNDQSKKLMKESEKLISKADEDIKSTKESVSQSVNKFEELKGTLLNTTFTQSQILLEKTSYEYSKAESDDPFEISLAARGEDVSVSNISSGAFTGLILGLIVALATVAGWIYFATTKLGVALTPALIENQTDQTTLFTWIGGGMTGGVGNPMFGMATVGISALVLGFMVYKLRVSMKENKNFKVANETFEKSNLYVQNQKETKTEMQKIDDHVQEIIPVIENYKILLEEQNAKLQRVVHVEGILDENSEYHPSSIATMQDSERMMERIEELLTIPVTKEGQLNDASRQSLFEAKSVYDYYISKIYA